MKAMSNRTLGLTCLLTFYLAVGRASGAPVPCEQVEWIVSDLQTDPGTGECYIEVSYNWPFFIAHGIDASVGEPAVITRVVQKTGFGVWYGCEEIPPNQQLSPSGDCESPFFPLRTHGWWSSSNCIPATTTLVFWVYLELNQVDPLRLWLRSLGRKMLEDDAPSTVDCWWLCQQLFTIPKREYRLTLVDCQPLEEGCYQVESGYSGKLRARTTGGYDPPAGSSIRWYSRTATTPCECDPFGAYWDSDGPQTTLADPEASLNPNPWSSSCCYVAVIDDGCYSYVTPPLHINVCPALQAIGQLKIDAASGSPALLDINGELHACNEWQGDRLRFDDPGVCRYTVNWTRTVNNRDPVPIGATQNTPELDISGNIGRLRYLPFLPGRCSTYYKFTADIRYSICGEMKSTTRELTVVIDKPTEPGTITAGPWDMCGKDCPVGHYGPESPVLCYNRATTLKYEGGCGSIVGWAFHPELNTFLWIPLSDVKQAASFNTNKLRANRTYRVMVKNGACPMRSAEIEVRVKPQLTALIQGNAAICAGSSTTLLSATTSYDAVGYHVEYQWRKDRSPIQWATDKTYTASDAGAYDVVVTDEDCCDTTSNIIYVCTPSISITGPALVCPGCSFTLTATVNDCIPCDDEVMWVWTLPDGSTALGASITTSLPTGASSGTYTVSAKCGEDEKCEVTAEHLVTICQ
jgi:hypothetical protein